MPSVTIPVVSEPQAQSPSKSHSKPQSLPSLIPIPEGYQFRSLQHGDYDRGFLATLGQLTTVGKVSKDDFLARLDLLNHVNGYHPYVLVNSSTDTVIAAATLVTEYKFIHGCGMLGHIEDVVVSGQERGGGSAPCL